uniref:tRNA(Ile)-lysidine synthase n=1 Tax=Synarthrophyton chejuense TaxID=2485825 RepID=A0A3G3MFM6_9FLOR|nr:tRNA(Ile)-lysidine synthase [Synarthrophyton chejuense]AYR05627.1 tRNA(Ile)-lysidine synthase [Synarthrophyton chejuense]
MHTFLHKKFRENFIGLTKKNTSSIIAISGGQDSLCLIKLLNDYHIKIKNSKHNFEAIYIDHQWQKNSFNHAKHIANIINTTNISLTIYQIKKPAFSEVEARAKRYKILINHALKYNYKYIITGHNQDDQTETFLQNLIRGSTIDGITSLYNNRKITENLSILRPMLNFSREEIKWFCRKFCLPIWSDASNYTYKIKRNRLRYELIPYLKQYFNPKLHKSINTFLNSCNKDNEYIKENSIKLYIKSKHYKFISLNIDIIRMQHKSLQARIIQMHFYYHFNKRIKKNGLINIIEIINRTQNIKEIIYSDNLIIQKINGWLYTTLK